MNKLIEILFKTAIIIGFLYAIHWLISTINTWTSSLISISESLKLIAEKLS